MDGPSLCIRLYLGLAQIQEEDLDEDDLSATVGQFSCVPILHQSLNDRASVVRNHCNHGMCILLPYLRCKQVRGLCMRKAYFQVWHPYIKEFTAAFLPFVIDRNPPLTKELQNDFGCPCEDICGIGTCKVESKQGMARSPVQPHVIPTQIGESALVNYHQVDDNQHLLLSSNWQC